MLLVHLRCKSNRVADRRQAVQANKKALAEAPSLLPEAPKVLQFFRLQQSCYLKYQRYFSRPSGSAGQSSIDKASSLQKAVASKDAQRYCHKLFFLRLFEEKPPKRLTQVAIYWSLDVFEENEDAPKRRLTKAFFGVSLED